MRQLTKSEFRLGIEAFAKQLKDEDCLFIYPTDTIYGLGCDATNEEAVSKLRKVKSKHNRPFSVIVPSKDWIYENCVVDDEVRGYIDKLPGPYTLILKLKNKDAVSELTNVGMDTIGVRIPDHWFSETIKDLGFPVVTTSANRMGENFMTKLEDLATDIKGYVDFIVYEGEIDGSPSTIINLVKDNVTIDKRD